MPPVVRTARDAAELCAPHLEDCRSAKLVVLHLDAERRLLRLWVEEAGEVPVGAIMADAIRCDSAGLVLAHCRADGDAAPTPADIAATRRLAQSAATLGITLYDHLVFAGEECRSFRTLGLM
jgi:DNA repair protein RadC